jgi:hypothetical protein
MAKVEKFRTSLMKLHDELADLKSLYDGHMSDDAFDDGSLGWANPSSMNKSFESTLPTPHVSPHVLTENEGASRNYPENRSRAGILESYNPTCMQCGGYLKLCPVNLPPFGLRSSRALMEDTKLRKLGPEKQNYDQRKLGSNISVLRANRILRLEMMKGGMSSNNI